MFDSFRAIQVLIKNYPEFEKLSDYFYDQEEVLLCVEMHYFAEYVWNLSKSDTSFDFGVLHNMLNQLILDGDIGVKNAITVCFVEHLDTLDDQAKNPDLTKKWLVKMSDILCKYHPSLERKSTEVG